MLRRSGDIRDQSLKWSKIDRNFACFACFWPRIFLEECPPNFWTCIIKLGQIPIMWQSFRAIGRGSSEETWRKKKKHHEHFIRPPVTPYGRPNTKNNSSFLLSTNNKLQYLKTMSQPPSYLNVLLSSLCNNRNFLKFLMRLKHSNSVLGLRS